MTERRRKGQPTEWITVDDDEPVAAVARNDKLAAGTTVVGAELLERGVEVEGWVFRVPDTSVSPTDTKFVFVIASDLNKALEKLRWARAGTKWSEMRPMAKADIRRLVEAVEKVGAINANVGLSLRAALNYGGITRTHPNNPWELVELLDALGEEIFGRSLEW